MDILIHTCCAPCLVKTAEVFSEEGYLPHIFWFNPNIHPYREYLRRREALFQYLQGRDYPFHDEDLYDLKKFLTAVDCGEERCFGCYRLRLTRTAEKASELSIHAFSTTLLISPHQNREQIIRVGERAADDAGVEFVHSDLRPHFREGQADARKLGLYLQPYCGCIFSEYERYSKREVELG